MHLGHTKTAAFFNRGIKDIYAGHDVEDMAYPFNCTTTIDEQILASENDVKPYLIEKLTTFKNHKTNLTGKERPASPQT